MKLTRLGWFALALAVPAVALLHDPAPPAAGAKSEDAVFRVSTSLVQVDAVVTDSKGHQVTDLKPDEFQLSIDGKPQSVTRLSYIRMQEAGTAAPLPPAPKAAAAKAAAPGTVFAPQTRLRREQIHSSVVLVVDDLGLSWESTAYVRTALKKFINQQMQPGQLVAIYQTGRSSGIFQQFTTDRNLLLAAVDRLRWNPQSRAGLSRVVAITHNPIPGGERPNGSAANFAAQAQDAQARFQRNADSDFYSVEKDNYAIGTLGSLNLILQALHGLPGRKALVLFSDGIDLSPTLSGQNQALVAAARNLIEHANRSGSVLYAVDARGLQPLQFTAEDNPNLRGMSPEAVAQALRAAQQSRYEEFQSEQTGLDFLAAKTGGSAFFNTNDMNWALDHVQEDQRGYYLLGFPPAPEIFKDKPGGNYHSIRVRVTRPGLHVRSRTGFFGATDEAVEPQYAKSTNQLQAAMLSPFNTQGVDLRVTPIYIRDDKKPPVVRNLLYINPKDVSFAKDPAGNLFAQLQMLAVAAGANNHILGYKGAAPMIQIPHDKIEQAMREGLLFGLDVTVSQPGSYQIRVAVRDAGSGRIGSASQFMELPNLKKGRPALLSLLLDRAGAGPESELFKGVKPANRQFHPGDEIEYFSVLENVGVEHGAATSAAKVEIKLYQGTQPIFTGTPVLTALAGSKSWAVRGKLRLGANLPAGDYYLQLVATDASLKRNNTAVAWTDFEVQPTNQARR